MISRDFDCASRLPIDPISIVFSALATAPFLMTSTQGRMNHKKKDVAPTLGTWQGWRARQDQRLPSAVDDRSANHQAKLEALTTLERRPAWKIVDDGINLYVHQIPLEDRRMVETLGKRAMAPRNP